MGQDWAELSSGRTIGKQINIAVEPGDSGSMQKGAIDMLQLQGNDDAALPLCLTLLPPRIVSRFQFPGAVVPMDGTIQNATGSMDNYVTRSNPPPGLNYSWSQAIAVVEWGIGGVQSKVECDFFNGLCLNLSASWIRVSAFVDAILDSAVVITGGAMNLAAFIGPGMPKPNNAQRTFNVGEVLPNDGNPNPAQSGFPNTFTVPLTPNGTVPVLPIPFYAKEATLIGNSGISSNDITGIDASIIFYRDINGTFKTGMYRFTGDTADARPVKIPNGSYYWTVRNNNVADSINFSCIFDLAV